MSYDFYVQADCGANGTSAWAGPFTFTTLCDAVTVFPYSEDFDTDWSCWSVNNADGDSNTWSQSATYITPRSGDYTAHGMGNNDDYLISPKFSLTGNERVVWYDIVESANYSNTYDVLLSTSGKEISDFTVNLGTYVCTNTSWTEHILDLSAYSGDVYIALHQTSSAATNFGFGVDDFTVEEIPSIPPGCASIFSDTLDTSCGNYDFSISWDAATNADGYYISVGTTSGGTDIEALIDLGNITTYDFTSPTIATTYYYTVLPYNAVGSASGCTEQTLTTVETGCYCISIPTSNDGLGISSVSFGANVFEVEDVEYKDLTATAVSIGQSTSASLEITFATGFGYDTHVWVDLNDDYDFSSDELMFSGESTGDNPTELDASFLVPSDAPLGNHRVRIGTADSGQGTPDPCYNGSYGVTIDMTITVTEPPLCLEPTDLTVADITTTTASVSWTANSSETAWEYQVVESGAAPAETGTGTTENTLALADLTDNTGYDVYVRANCGNDGTSEWVMVSFTTLPAPIVPEYTNDFSTFPGDLWTTDTGVLNTLAGWEADGFANDGTSGAAKINIYTTSFSGPQADDALISPSFNLSGGTYYLNMTAALTPWNATSDGAFGEGDYVSVSVTENAGDTWVELFRWDQTNTPAATGAAMPELDLSDYASSSVHVKIFAQSGTEVVDNDFFIDDFSVTSTSLGLEDVNTVSNFTFFPNPVNNVLTIKAQASIDSVIVYNMLGQAVVRSTPNTNDSTVDMSALQTGAYFVQVSINNTLKTVRVIKN
jgi:hypothetical protein